MLTEQTIRESAKGRAWAVFPTVICTLIVLVAYCVAVETVREYLITVAVDHFGEMARDFAPVLLLIAGLLIFLIPIIAAAIYANRFKLICPSCENDITSHFMQLLATRCCPFCEQNIVAEGRIRTAATYQRFLAIRERSYLRKWLWAWPGLGILFITLWLFDPSSFQKCPQVLFVPALIGTTTSGWAWLRTFDYRYVPSLLASSITLRVGAWLFWYAL